MEGLSQTAPNARVYKDLGLDLTATYSRNRNEITKLNGPAFAIGGNFGAQWALEGYPLGTFYWRAYARNPDGSLLLTPGGLPQAERGTQGDISDPSSSALLQPSRTPFAPPTICLQDSLRTLCARHHCLKTIVERFD